VSLILAAVLGARLERLAGAARKVSTANGM